MLIIWQKYSENILMNGNIRIEKRIIYSMKRIVFLVMVIFLMSCQEVTTETEQHTVEQQEVKEPEGVPDFPVDPNRESLDFLNSLEGKYPSDSDLFGTEPMKERLTKLLGNKYMDFIQRMDVQVPIKITDGIVMMRGIMTHGGGTEEAVLAVNIAENVIWVGILQNGEKISQFNEDSDVRMPHSFFTVILGWNT